MTAPRLARTALLALALGAAALDADTLAVTLSQALTVGPSTRLEFKREDGTDVDVELPRAQWQLRRESLGLNNGGRSGGDDLKQGVGRVRQRSQASRIARRWRLSVPQQPPSTLSTGSGARRRR